MDDFTGIAQDVSQMLIQMYQAVTHKAILDLSKQVLVVTHGNMEQEDRNFGYPSVWNVKSFSFHWIC
jgi:hypothetical protein